MSVVTSGSISTVACDGFGRLLSRCSSNELEQPGTKHEHGLWLYSIKCDDGQAHDC